MLSKIKISVKDSIIYSFGNVSTKLIGLILLPIYTEKLSVAEYGVLGTLEITLQTLVALFSFALYQAFSRWYWDKKYQDKQQSLFFTSLVFIVISTGLMLILMFLISGPFSVFLLGSTDYSYLLMLMIGSAAMQIIARIPLTLMRLQRKALLFSLSNIVKLTVTLILTIYFVVSLERGVAGIFEAQIIGFVVFFMFNAKFIWKNIAFQIQIKLLKEMLRFSYPLMVSSVGGVLLTVVDKYLVRFIGGMEDIGLYALGFKVANVLKILVINSVLPALLPIKLQMMDRPDGKRFYSKIFTYTLFGFAFFLMGITFFGKELVVLLASNPDFWSAYHIIPFICFAQLFEMLRRSANIGLIIQKKTKIISRIMLGIAILAIPLNILFIYVFDIIGAAIATLISQILYFCFIYINAQKHYPIPYEINKTLKIIGLAVVLTVLAYLSNSIAVLPRITIKIILIASFPIVLYFWDFYDPIELKRLKQGYHKWKNPRAWGKHIKNIKL